MAGRDFLRVVRAAKHFSFDADCHGAPAAASTSPVGGSAAPVGGSVIPTAGSPPSCVPVAGLSPQRMGRLTRQTGVAIG